MGLRKPNSLKDALAIQKEMTDFSDEVRLVYTAAIKMSGSDFEMIEVG
jgi:hypothetical protein